MKVGLWVAILLASFASQSAVSVNATEHNVLDVNSRRGWRSAGIEQIYINRVEPHTYVNRAEPKTIDDFPVAGN